MITGDRTVYFATYYSTSREPMQLHCAKMGPMNGPLLDSVMDRDQAYHRQGEIYRLDNAGQPVLLWNHRTGYAKPEFDPEYIKYMELRDRYEGVDTKEDIV